jgi:hypothetical protein
MTLTAAFEKDVRVWPIEVHITRYTQGAHANWVRLTVQSPGHRRFYNLESVIWPFVKSRLKLIKSTSKNYNSQVSQYNEVDHRTVQSSSLAPLSAALKVPSMFEGFYTESIRIKFHSFESLNEFYRDLRKK